MFNSIITTKQNKTTKLSKCQTCTCSKMNDNISDSGYFFRSAIQMHTFFQSVFTIIKHVQVLFSVIIEFVMVFFFCLLTFYGGQKAKSSINIEDNFAEKNIQRHTEMVEFIFLSMSFFIHDMFCIFEMFGSHTELVEVYKFQARI